MWLVLGALRRPITVLVAALSLLILAGLTLRRAPVDIFPDLGIPVIYVVQPYGGMSPAQMEAQVVTFYEYHFLYIAGIEHIESQSIQGMAMLKLYFHPGTNIPQATAQVTAMAFRATSFMPQGTLPPFIVRFDAGSIPIGQLTFSSPQRSEAELQDLALFRVRPLLATLPGVSAPPPSGGKVRTIVVYLDPAQLRAFRIAPDEVAAAVARGNLTLPSGNVRIGDYTRLATTNAIVQKPADLDLLPVRTGSGPTVLLRDVARVEDAADVVYNIALVNGRRTVYMPLTKRADASTLDVVSAVKNALPKMRAQVPEDVEIRLEFDQSVYVKSALRGLLIEGALGALLTGLLVFLFLRNIRSAAIVLLTIPLAVLAAMVALLLVGQTFNIMTIGGLALSVGILVDESTVAIENIHTHLQHCKSPSQAVVDGMSEVTLPRLLALLCVLAVFIPSFFLVGIGRALLPPLALAVGFAMVASYFLSSTLVPVLSVWLLRGTQGHASASVGSPSARLQGGYRRLCAALIGHRWLVLSLYVALCGGGLFLSSRLGVELFPRIDHGQIRLRIRAPDGTRLERTEEIVRSVEQSIREAVGDRAVRITLANIGNPPWTYPVNGVYVWNAGPHEALLLIALGDGKRPSMPRLEESLRQKLSERFPTVRFSFEPGDIVSQVLNFGSATPLQVNITGTSLPDTRAVAERLMTKLRTLPMLRDVQIPLALDYPSLDVNIDRERAGQLGTTVDRIGRSLVVATSSSALIAPNFWVNPANGVPYRIALRVPENQVASPEDVRALPVMPDASSTTTVGDVATVREGKTLGEIDHYNSQRTIPVVANLAGRDLGGAAKAVEHAVADLGPLPRGVTITLRGQAEQMRLTLLSLREGLLLAALAVVLLLMTNFQSVREPLLVLLTLPATVVGSVVLLWLTGTTLNVQSAMGVIMALGVSVATTVLLLSFARTRRQLGDSRLNAATHAAVGRLRPILMTSLAMIAGMVPMALGLGEGGEQSAPLGRAVLGGLVAATATTLFVLPALYCLVARAAPFRSASLHPADQRADHADDQDAQKEDPREA
jgi:multidrug efflux pump subunit AcrB